MSTKSSILLSNFEILSDMSDKSASGGNSVQLARDSRDGKLYIIKHLQAIDSALISALQKVNTGTPKIFDICTEDDGSGIIIEEYINLATLSSVLQNEKLTANDISKLLISLCDILKPLHSQMPAIIHRDIKPDNILIDLDGLRDATRISYSSAVYLIDFDAAKQVTADKSRDTKLMGTTAFAAPEQYGFAQSDVRTDIFGLGRVLNYCLKNSGVTDMHLESIVKKATQLAPNDRFQSVSDMRDAIMMVFYDSSDGKSGSEKAYHKFLPPGFRSGNTFNMVIAICGYMICLYLAIGIDSRVDTFITQLFTKVCAFMLLFSQIALITNYLDIRDNLPLINSDTKPVRTLGIITYVIANWLGWIALSTIFDSIVGNFL